MKKKRHIFRFFICSNKTKNQEFGFIFRFYFQGQKTDKLLEYSSLQVGGVKRLSMLIGQPNIIT